jgi:hypothetical protein
VAFLRFNRDKRGYEHFYLVEAKTNRRGKTRARVLYWFRTPPNVKVGREPFDAEVREALESQYPGVSFDWRKIVETPIPSADAERWRERRRLERAEKAARQTIVRERLEMQQTGEVPIESLEPEEIDPLEALAESPDVAALAEEAIAANPADAEETAAITEAIQQAAPAASSPLGHRRRRRRRRRGPVRDV